MISPEQDVPTDFTPNNLLISFLRTARAVFFSPGLFYERMKTHGGMRNPLLFLICCVMINALLGSLWIKDQAIIVRNIAFGIGMPFVTAGILFLIITRLFKAAGTYEAAFRVNAYAAALNLLSWIPILWLFVLIELYRVYVIALGLSRTFSIRVPRALLAIVLTGITYWALGSFVAHILGIQTPTPVP
jgi:hypothetical protein